MRAPEPLLERDALERLERLALLWRNSFPGLLGGQNVSKFAGAGHEFLDHRHFQQGDDPRSVNWRVYLRLERLFLKMFRTEPRTPIRLLIDVSESMALGGPPGEAKFAYACRLAAALSYVALTRLETIVLQPFGQRPRESFRVQGGRHRFSDAARFLSALETGGRSNFMETVRAFSQEVLAPGFVIVFSDFLDDGDCAEALRLLADQGHELQLAHLVAPEDRRPSWEGEAELVDAETGETMRVQLDDAGAREYERAFEAYCAGIEDAALRNGGRYLRLGTEVPLEEALYGSLRSAGAVGAR